jgi:hypothetical protein
MKICNKKFSIKNIPFFKSLVAISMTLLIGCDDAKDNQKGIDFPEYVDHYIPDDSLKVSSDDSVVVYLSYFPSIGQPCNTKISVKYGGNLLVDGEVAPKNITSKLNIFAKRNVYTSFKCPSCLDPKEMTILKFTPKIGAVAVGQLKMEDYFTLGDYCQDGIVNHLRDCPSDSLPCSDNSK